MAISEVNNPVVAIIGGGVAGMSCALWLKLLGLSPYIIERNASLGGQLLDITRINRWVLGLPNLSSAELAGIYSQHISDENIPVKYHSQLQAVELVGPDYRLLLQEANFKTSTDVVQALVIATGVRFLHREIFSQIPQFDTLLDKGLVHCFPTDHLDKLSSLHGKIIAIIGGGDNAHFTAKDLASVASCIYLLIRSQPKAHSRIRKEVEALIEQGKIIELQATSVKAFRPIDQGIELSLETADCTVTKLKVDRVFTRTGFTANCQFLDNLPPLAQIEKLSNGYLVTDAACRTSIASVYAIGDVSNPEMQSVVTAIADGAKAARTIEMDLGSRERY